MPHKSTIQQYAKPIDSLFWIMLASMAILCTATILIWYCMPAAAGGKTVNTPQPLIVASIELDGTLKLIGGHHLHLSIKDSQLFEVGCTYIITVNRHSNLDTLVAYQKVSCP